MFSKTLIVRLKVDELVHGMRYIDGNLTIITIAPTNDSERSYRVHPVQFSRGRYLAKAVPTRPNNLIDRVDSIGGDIVCVKCGNLGVRTLSLHPRDKLYGVVNVRRVELLTHKHYRWVCSTVDDDDIEPAVVMRSRDKKKLSVGYGDAIRYVVEDRHSDPEYRTCETKHFPFYLANTVTCVSVNGNIYTSHENDEGFRVIRLAADCLSVRYSKMLVPSKYHFFDIAISDDERFLAVSVSEHGSYMLEKAEVHLYRVDVSGNTLVTHVATYAIPLARYVAFNPDGLTLNVLTGLQDKPDQLYTIDL